MKTVLLILLVIFSINNVFGQKRLLNPCITFSDRIPGIKAYEDALKSKLDAELSPDYLIRFVVKPSISPEYVLQIEKEDDRFIVVTILFRENCWNSQNRDTIKATRFEKSIPREVVSPLDSLAKRITKPSRLNNSYLGVGEDGTNYLFYYRSSASTQCGECWSPSNDTALFELVHIFEQMVSYSQDRKVDLSALFEQITGLNRRIKR